jgi:hypothetical protein
MVDFVLGSCTMPFTATKFEATQGSVSVVVASSPGAGSSPAGSAGSVEPLRY